MAAISDTLVEMEGRLQQIIGLTESLKLQGDVGEPMAKRQKIEARNTRRKNDNMVVPVEIRLRRFLYMGEEVPLYQPGPRNLERVDEPSIEEMLLRHRESKKQEEKGDAPKQTEEDIAVIAAISSALENPNNPYPECPIFALALCMRHEYSGDDVREAAYKVARRCLVSMEQMFLFIKHATFLTRKDGKGTGGWGAGMRRLVSQWYLKQDPVQLARSVSHQRKWHKWSHKDIIKLSHVKPSDKEVALQAVLSYIFKGLSETETKFGSDEKAAEVLQVFRQRKLELQADTQELAKLAEGHKLTLLDLPSNKTESSDVWCAVLKNMSTDEILDNVPRICCLRCSGADEVRKAAAAELTKEGATADPGRVYVILKDYLKTLVTKGHSFESGYVKERRLKETFPVKEPCSIIVGALNTLLNNSFKSMTAAGVRVLVAVDLREGGSCQWTHSVNTMEAAALTSLYLARTHKRFTLTAFTEGQELQIVSVPKSATVESMVEKFKELQANAAKEPTVCEPLSWARERKRDLDLFVVLTPALKDWKWKGHDIGKALQQYRDVVKKPDAKLAVCAFGNMTLQVGSYKAPGILDLAGFHYKTIQVLNAFAMGSI